MSSFVEISLIPPPSQQTSERIHFENIFFLSNDSKNIKLVNLFKLDNIDLCNFSSKHNKDLNKCQQIISILESRERGLNELMRRMKVHGWKIPCGSFNPLLRNYSMSGKVQEALDLYHHPAFHPDSFTFEIVITHVCRKGDWKQVLFLHEQMRQAGFIPTTSTFSSLIRGSLKVENLDISLKSFYSMRDLGVKPVTTAT